MSVFMVFWQDEVTDREGLAAYQKAAGPTLGPFKPTPKVVSEKLENVEGDWNPGRMVILEFETREQAMGWYNSPEYSAVKQQRLASTKGGGGVIVDTIKLG